MEEYGIVSGVGFVRKSLEQSKSDSVNRLKVSFGDEWEAEETAGEYILTKNALYEVDLLWQLAQEMYSFMDDETTKDTIQDSKYKLIGLKRKEKTLSFVDVSFTGTPNHTISIGLLAKDNEKDIEYQLTETVVLDAEGNGSGQFKSILKGEGSKIEKNTLTVLVTVDPDINTITNDFASSGGLEEETNDQFRSRKEKYLDESESSNTPAIRNAVLSLDSVSNCEGYENSTNEYNVEYDLQPGETRMIVQGVNSEDVARAIFNVVASGIGTVGAYSYEIEGDNAQIKKVFFDLAKNKVNYCKVEVSELAEGATLTEDLITEIESVVVEYYSQLKIKQKVSATKLASLITSTIADVFDCMVFISETVDTENWIRYITCAYDEIGYTDREKISVVTS